MFKSIIISLSLAHPSVHVGGLTHDILWFLIFHKCQLHQFYVRMKIFSDVTKQLLQKNCFSIIINMARAPNVVISSGDNFVLLLWLMPGENENTDAQISRGYFCWIGLIDIISSSLVSVVCRGAWRTMGKDKVFGMKQGHALHSISIRPEAAAHSIDSIYFHVP
jgi:hypothetical protein